MQLTQLRLNKNGESLPARATVSSGDLSTSNWPREGKGGASDNEVTERGPLGRSSLLSSNCYCRNLFKTVK